MTVTMDVLVHLSLLQFCTICVIVGSIAVFSSGQNSRLGLCFILLTFASLMPDKMPGTQYICVLMNEGDE